MEHSYWLRAINLDLRPLDEYFTTKLRCHLHGTILEGNSIFGLNQKNGARKESSWFGEPRCKLGSKVVFSIVFIVFQSIFFTCFLN
jgi:hypothetical protein